MRAALFRDRAFRHPATEVFDICSRGPTISRTDSMLYTTSRPILDIRDALRSKDALERSARLALTPTELLTNNGLNAFRFLYAHSTGLQGVVRAMCALGDHNVNLLDRYLTSIYQGLDRQSTLVSSTLRSLHGPSVQFSEHCDYYWSPTDVARAMVHTGVRYHYGVMHYMPQLLLTDNGHCSITTMMGQSVSDTDHSFAFRGNAAAGYSSPKDLYRSWLLLPSSFSELGQTFYFEIVHSVGSLE